MPVGVDDFYGEKVQIAMNKRVHTVNKSQQAPEERVATPLCIVRRAFQLAGAHQLPPFVSQLAFHNLQQHSRLMGVRHMQLDRDSLHSSLGCSLLARLTLQLQHKEHESDATQKQTPEESDIP